LNECWSKLWGTHSEYTWASEQLGEVLRWPICKVDATRYVAYDSFFLWFKTCTFM